MAESISDIVKRASIYIPPDNRRCYIKRLQLDGEYESAWFEITKYVTRWGTIQQGFPDNVFIGEYVESDISMDLNNSSRSFNAENDPNSFFYGFRTRFRTQFKLEIYAVDNEDNDVLLKAWYGISFSNPVTDDKSDMTFSLSPMTKIFQYYAASGIDITSATTATMISRLVNMTKNGSSLFSKYFTSFSINPDAGSVTTISHPYIEEGETVLDKLRNYSFYDDYFYYVDNSGNFVWTDRDPTASVIWEFNGAGNTDSTYGTNIQGISSFYDDIDNTYTKVALKFSENTVLPQTFFEGIGFDDGTATYLSTANSSTIYAQLVTDLYIGTDSRLTQLYSSSRTVLETYLSSSWPDYDQNILSRLDETVKATEKTVTSATTWVYGDGSVADIYGEKVFTGNYKELITSEATTIADRILANYKNSKEIINSTVTGAFHLEPKDKVEANYLGELTVNNPFILGVSLLGNGDVLAGRTGSIRLNAWSGKVTNVSINLDNFNINQKWREI